MRTVCKKNSCMGCMACIGKCMKNAIDINDDLIAYNAVIDEDKCVNCGMCEKVCPNNQMVEKHNPISWKEGWASEDIRGQASSGGAASAMMEYFVKNGGYVAACLFKQGEFVFEITNRMEILKDFVGSKYVKSNPIGIYDRVVERLKKGDRVLFIGLPCQVAAMKNSVNGLSIERKDNLYTVDLICHGSPSPRILNMALEESGIDIKQLKKIRFRNKTNFGLSSQNIGKEYKTLTVAGVQDMYTYAFLTSLDYTENCYFCQYATIERVADVTIGDSWGTELSQEEQDKGVSLLLCQTNKGVSLVKNSGMKLKKVDIDKAIEANHQLRHPSVAPNIREIFFSNLDKGFYKAMSKCAPKVYYKQKIKEILIRLKIIRGGENR